MKAIQETKHYTTLQKFKKNFWGVFSLSYLFLCVLLAVFAYTIAPDASRNANQMHLSIHSKPPGFRVTMLEVDVSHAQEVDIRSFFFGKQTASSFIPITDFQIEGNTLKVHEYSDAGPGQSLYFSLADFPELDRLEQVEEKYINEHRFMLGTDKFGRDLLSRILIGTRISLGVGVIAVGISLIIGIILGALAGYYGGATDRIIMWLINVTWSIPTLLLVIALTLALGRGVWQVFLAVGLTMWVEVARVVRGQVMSVKNMQYVTAAKALGYGHYRILRKHVLPNALAPVIIISAANFASAILVESGLSFLGIGAQPPMPSWGGIIKDHYHYVFLGKPYLALIPGIAIMSLVMAFMLLGNALRDVLDVRGK